MGQEPTDKRSVDGAEPQGAGDPEVGRIVLGERRFAVVRALERRGRQAARELHRFDLVGHRLAIIEAGDKAATEGLGAPEESPAHRLTGRELEIAALVAQGHANKNIAYRLQISEWTVATYLRRIFLKLDVESRAAMVFRCAPLLKATDPKAGGAATRR